MPHTPCSTDQWVARNVPSCRRVAVVGKWQAWFFVLLQLTAAAGAFLFGFIQDRIGAKKAIGVTLIIWVTTILGIYGIQEITTVLNRLFAWDWEPRVYFLIVGNLAGFCLGATQSASRALVGKFAPLSRAGEFFGFWGLAGKLAAAFGLVVFGLQDLARLKNSVLLCAVFFLLAFLIMLAVNERRGTEVARSYREES